LRQENLWVFVLGANLAISESERNFFYGFVFLNGKFSAMIFSDRKSVDRLPKKGDVHGSCKNPFSSCPRQSASGVISEDGADEKPRLVFKIKLPPSQNKGEKPCKVSEDRADEKPVPTLQAARLLLKRNHGLFSRSNYHHLSTKGKSLAKRRMMARMRD
jgi:hypothetical protein